MAYGKTIELFLANGTNDGVVTAELSNWSGKAIKIPRIDIKQSQREDITNPGVYFLLCENENGTTSAYIGEAENVKDRLVTHINDYNTGKELYYWATAIIFIGRDLNKTLIRYLEKRLVEIANESGKYNVLTKNTYKNTIIKESQKANMEEFIDNIKILLKVLGYDFLEASSRPTTAQKILYCKGNNAVATGFVSSNGFTVIKNSIISDHTVPSFETNVVSWFELRNKLETDGTITNGMFTKDYEFSSPSAASAIVLGRPSNGNSDWKDEKGTSLKDLI